MKVTCLNEEEGKTQNLDVTTLSQFCTCPEAVKFHACFQTVKRRVIKIDIKTVCLVLPSGHHANFN